MVPAPSGHSPAVAATDNVGVIRFTGGCSPFGIYAQNHWPPYGAAVRTAPNITSKQIAGRDPNQSIAVGGWVHGAVAYSTNQRPWNSDIWLHLADGAGWVSFASIRALPTDPDPTLRDNGGPPAPTTPGCQGSAQ